MKDINEEREDLVSMEDVIEEVESEGIETEQDDIESVEQADELDDDSEQELDEQSAKAKKYGHLSKDDWIAQGKDPKLWKSPEEFNKTGEILEQIYSLRKQVELRDRELKNVVEYHKKASQREYERARQDLEQRLAASKDDMDVEGVSHYTKELTRLEDYENQTQTQQKQQSQQDAESRFVERNQHWYNERNADLVRQAHAISAELQSIYPSASPDELAQKIELRMQYEHPERVNGQTKARPSISPSRSSVNKTAITKKNSFGKLSQELKDTFNVYKRINPSITEADFIARMQAEGEL